MANKACVNRLQKEYKHIVKEPVPFLSAHPSPSNILEWHFVIEGQPDSEYAGGVYHGKITFPAQYPFKPPSLQMITPNGRFATNTRLCLSMTDFHPESWNPMWSVSTILTGLMSFMYETAHTTGAISSTKEEKQRLARESLAYNMRSPLFRKLFPEWVARHEEQQRTRAAATQQQQQQQQAAQQQQQRQAQAPAPPADPAAAVAPVQQQAMEREALKQQQQEQQGVPQQGAAAGAAGGWPWQGWIMGAASVALLALLWAATAGTSS